jgi:ribosome modulation factor
MTHANEAQGEALLDPTDFALYDRMLDHGRRAYLAGLSRDVCPHPLGSKEREFWMEGYDP